MKRVMDFERAYSLTVLWFKALSLITGEVHHDAEVIDYAIYFMKNGFPFSLVETVEDYVTTPKMMESIPVLNRVSLVDTYVCFKEVYLGFRNYLDDCEKMLKCIGANWDEDIRHDIKKTQDCLRNPFFLQNPDEFAEDDLELDLEED